MFSAGHAEAKASYMDLAETVSGAEAVAVIHTEATAPCEIEGEYNTYRQKVFATPMDVLKGELGSPFELLAQKNFICGSVTYDAPADYLVLLHRDNGHWTTLNHGKGALRIDSEEVQWPYGSEPSIPLDDALARVRVLIGEQPAVEVAEPVAPDPPKTEAPPVAEPQPCGYAIGRMQEAEETRERWVIVGAAGAGAAAIMLGFFVGFRRRRRS